LNRGSGTCILERFSFLMKGAEQPRKEEICPHKPKGSSPAQRQQLHICKCGVLGSENCVNSTQKHKSWFCDISKNKVYTNSDLLKLYFIYICVLSFVLKQMGSRSSISRSLHTWVSHLLHITQSKNQKKFKRMAIS
jgi:hypothetical protein